MRRILMLAAALCLIAGAARAEADRATWLRRVSLDLTGLPPTPEEVDAFLEFVGDAPLIAHNAEFDMRFVNFELEKCGRPPIREEQWVDTLALAKKRAALPALREPLSDGAPVSGYQHTEDSHE